MAWIPSGHVRSTYKKERDFNCIYIFLNVVLTFFSYIVYNIRLNQNNNDKDFCILPNKGAQKNKHDVQSGHYSLVSQQSRLVMNIKRLVLKKVSYSVCTSFPIQAWLFLTVTNSRSDDTERLIIGRNMYEGKELHSLVLHLPCLSLVISERIHSLSIYHNGITLLKQSK